MPALTLNLQDIHRSKIGKDGRCFPILQGVSLDITPGSIIGIYGHSGSGKSTLLRLLNRLEDPNHGAIWYGNTNLLTMNPLSLRRKIALVAQKPIIFPGTVADNIMLADTITGLGNGDIAKAQALLDTMQLPAASLQRNATELSVGQQARVQLARILYLAPEILMLDETTAHLDMKVSTRILDELETAARRARNIIIHVSHEKIKLQRTDRIFVLNDGRITAQGTPQEIFANIEITSEAQSMAETND